MTFRWWFLSLNNIITTLGTILFILNIHKFEKLRLFWILRSTILYLFNCELCIKPNIIPLDNILNLLKIKKYLVPTQNINKWLKLQYKFHFIFYYKYNAATA